MRRPPKFPQPAWIAALLVAFVLLIGLSRVLVLCSSDGEAGHLAFAHAPGACCGCEHDGDTQRSSPPRDGRPTAAALAECEHRELAIELAPAPPRSATSVAAPVTCLGDTAPYAWRNTGSELRVVHPQATGPPRPDPQLAHRSTIWLLL